MATEKIILAKDELETAKLKLIKAWLKRRFKGKRKMDRHDIWFDFVQFVDQLHDLEFDKIFDNPEYYNFVIKVDNEYENSFELNPNIDNVKILTRTTPSGFFVQRPQYKGGSCTRQQTGSSPQSSSETTKPQEVCRGGSTVAAHNSNNVGATGGNATQIAGGNTTQIAGGYTTRPYRDDAGAGDSKVTVDHAGTEGKASRIEGGNASRPYRDDGRLGDGGGRENVVTKPKDRKSDGSTEMAETLTDYWARQLGSLNDDKSANNEDDWVEEIMRIPPSYVDLGKEDFEV